MKKITVILCLLLSINAFSQSDFRKGFIINKHGEKISGFVNYKENKTIYEYCEFKNTLNGNVIKYSPEKISAYGYDNIKEFIAKPLNNKNVFLEVIIKGKASLFKHLKKFYLELDNVFKELENEIVEYQNDDLVRYKRQSNRYKGILKVFFKDCPKVNSKINNVAYLEKSLSKIVVDFNTCKGEESIVIKNKVNKIEVLFGASIGFVYSNLRFDINRTEAIFFTDKTKSSSTVSFGLHSEIFFPRISDKISLFTGVKYLKNNFSNIYTKNVNNSYRNEYIVNHKNNELSIFFGPRYTIRGKKFTPFFTVGLISTINFNSTTNWDETLYYDNIYNYHIEYQTNKLSYGYFISAGVKKKISKKLNGFLNLAYSNTVTNSKSERSNNLIIIKKSDHINIFSNLQVSIGVDF